VTEEFAAIASGAAADFGLWRGSLQPGTKQENVLIKCDVNSSTCLSKSVIKCAYWISTSQIISRVKSTIY
jgi:hypothetical protein